MTKPWAKEKTRRKKAEEARRAEEEKEFPALVSTPTPLPTSAVLALLSMPDEQERQRFHAGRLRWQPGDQMRCGSTVYSIGEDGLVSSWCESACEQPLAAIHVASSQSIPRDFSALRSESPHPWRTIRRRNHRLLPQRRAQRPFPKSFPKRTTISAPRADTVLALQSDLPRPSSPPPQPDPPLLSPPSIVNTTPPSIEPATTLPAETAYGLVQTKFALACARELPHITVTLDQVFDVVWGPHATNKNRNLLVKLPPDRLVFLCTLAAIAALEPVFEGFLQPAITDFAHAWVAHCRGESFG
ncbi:hypothetical protein C8R43DRAFT_947811 [Mycena crocata]|nr:hypothetical protein C8R43DRAFT_947811 [Mycena crocata]